MQRFLNKKTLDKITKIKVKISVNSCRNCKYCQSYRELRKKVIIACKSGIYCSTTFPHSSFFIYRLFFSFNFFIQSQSTYMWLFLDSSTLKMTELHPKFLNERQVSKRSKEKFLGCLEKPGKSPFSSKKRFY